MELVIVHQPAGSSLCGQACIAMAAGVSLDEAIEAVGHAKATSTKEVVAGLRKLQVEADSRCRRVSHQRPKYPRRALLVARNKGCTNWHWLLHWDGKIYDPGEAWAGSYAGWTITSALALLGRWVVGEGGEKVFVEWN